MNRRHFIPAMILGVFVFSISCNRPTDNQGAFILAESDLADYESDIDHAGIIKSLDDESFKRGRDIYGSVCFN